MNLSHCLLWVTFPSAGSPQQLKMRTKIIKKGTPYRSWPSIRGVADREFLSVVWDSPFAYSACFPHTAHIHFPIFPNPHYSPSSQPYTLIQTLLAIILDFLFLFFVPLFTGRAKDTASCLQPSTESPFPDPFYSSPPSNKDPITLAFHFYPLNSRLMTASCVDRHHLRPSIRLDTCLISQSGREDTNQNIS